MARTTGWPGAKSSTIVTTRQSTETSDFTRGRGIYCVSWAVGAMRSCLPICTIPSMVSKHRMSLENVHLVVKNWMYPWTMARPSIKIELCAECLAQETSILSTVTGWGSQPARSQICRKSDHNLQQKSRTPNGNPCDNQPQVASNNGELAKFLSCLHLGTNQRKPDMLS